MPDPCLSSLFTSMPEAPGKPKTRTYFDGEERGERDKNGTRIGLSGKSNDIKSYGAKDGRRTHVCS
jgi:hypothetical protein